MKREYDVDAIYDDARQKLLDARNEGAEAARTGKHLGANPYFLFEPENIQWNEGWMEALGFITKEKAA